MPTNLASQYWVLKDPNGNEYGQKGRLNPTVEAMFASKRAARAGFTWWKKLHHNITEVDKAAATQGWTLVAVNVSANDSSITEPLYKE